MKRNSSNVLFFIKKAKPLKNGEASVCMRITVNGARVETNIRKSIDPASWNQAKECACGKSRKACDLNAYIEDAKIKLHQIFNELEEQRQPITARLLQDAYVAPLDALVKLDQISAYGRIQVKYPSIILTQTLNLIGRNKAQCYQFFTQTSSSLFGILHITFFGGKLLYR